MLISYFRGGNFFDTAFYNPVIDDFDLQIQSATATQIVGVNPGTGVVTTFTGTGFPASPVPPLSGTLTGFSMIDAQGHPLATISGISWGLQAALTAIDAAVGSDATGLLAGLLSLQPITIDATAAVEGLFGLQLDGITSAIRVIGSGFADDIFGGAGNDTIKPGAAPSSVDEPDRIHASTGNDTLDFSNIPPDNAWLELVYEDLTGPITLNINALTNTGTVIKGPGQGTDTLVNVANRMTNGLDVYGSILADSFTVRTVANSGIWLAGGRGADSYNLTLAEGSGITLNFGFTFNEGPTQGLVFNGTTGVIANDGFGFAETLALTRIGDVNGSELQIRGTRFSDRITGSAGRDSIRSDGGNDTLDGGAGFDRIRFDRPQYTSGVTVDLVAGTATGIAQGAAFSHSLIRIEEVRGSQFNDTIRGSGVAERLEGQNGDDLLDGRGGDDSLFGDAGDDDLIGDAGNDSLVGGSGNDYLEGGLGNDTLDASADPIGFGDYVRPGLGTNTILGSQTLYQVGEDGIDISYSDVSGVGGLTILVGANGSGTVTSGIAGRVNDTFTWTHFFQGSQDSDTITVTGSSGDRFEGFSGYAGNDTIDGGSGYDDIDYRSEAREHLATAQGIVVSMATGLATDTYGDIDTLRNIEAVRGTHLADTVTAANTANAELYFQGYAGADVFNGSAQSYDHAGYSSDADDGGTLGIRADLAAGTVIDGFGDTDRVTSIDEITGTRFDDIMTAVGTSAAIKFRGEGGNDSLRGGTGNDRMEGGDGNDTVFGGAGSDEIEGGSGNDFINPGDNTDYDYIDAGVGNDTISFADLVNGYIDLGHGDLNAGIAVVINGLTNSGSINKGVNGTTTLIGIANPIAAGAVNGGLGLRGTNFNDSFTVTNTATGYVQIQGGRGADTFTLQPGTGTIRLVYDEGDVTNGIVMNLATGIVSNDGYGFVDTIIGGGVNNIQATRFADVILGSAAGRETYILEGGNDTVNGGGGYDIVRFDRGGVAGVNVDLAAFTASGVWEGVAFTSRLVDIDEVRGSREGNDTIRGDGAANLFQGRGGNDALDGRGGNDSLFGEDGNDRVRGGGGRDLLDGGANDDRLYGDGLKVAFAADTSAQVFRLYQATLNRAPDTGGHLDWTTRLVEGDNTLSSVAASFVGSREFTNVYGAGLTNTQFVTLLYNNVLHRAPDQTGLDSWLTRMTNGTSRADVVVGFSESGEFKNATRTAGNNFTQSHTDQVWSDDVFRLFQATLNRAPDLAGFTDWTNRLGTGTDFLAAVGGFVGSREFTNIYGASLTNTQFVTLLYDNVLDRAPDTAGLNDWLARMAGGTTRAAVVQGFSQSGEFINRTAADLTAWMRLQGNDDVLQGGAGNNTLTGGSLSDTFIFDSSLGSSTHRVLDLEVWDTLDFRNFGYAQDSDIRAHLSQVGADVVFADDAVTVTLVGTQLSRITDDMLFS